MNKMLYLLELYIPTNTQDLLITKVFDNKEEALIEAKDLSDCLDDDDDYGISCCGPNWKYIFKVGCVSVKEIDNTGLDSWKLGN